MDGALRYTEDFVRVYVFVFEGCCHIVHVEMNEHALAVHGGTMQNCIGVIVIQGNRVIALPCNMMLPGKVQRFIQICEIILFAAELPEDLSCGSAYAEDRVHISCGDYVVAGIGLVHGVDMEEVESVFFGSAVAVFGVWSAEDIFHAYVVGCSPFE